MQYFLSNYEKCLMSINVWDLEISDGEKTTTEVRDIVMDLIEKIEIEVESFDEVEDKRILGKLREYLKGLPFDWYNEDMVEGSEITREFYYQQLEVLPPKYRGKWVFQVGEPIMYSDEDKGWLHSTFGTFQDRFFWLGEFTTEKAKSFTVGDLASL